MATSLHSNKFSLLLAEYLKNRQRKKGSIKKKSTSSSKISDVEMLPHLPGSAFIETGALFFQN